MTRRGSGGEDADAQAPVPGSRGRPGRQLPQEIDQTDRQIIRALRQDPRATYKAIADRLGVSHNTVKARLDRLFEDHVIRLAVLAYPPKVGLPAMAHIRIAVEPAHLEDVARKLGERREITFLALTLGDEDIVAISNFENNERLFHFVNLFVGKLPGVKAVSTTVIAQALKWDPNDTTALWPMDSDLPVARDRGA